MADSEIRPGSLQVLRRANRESILQLLREHGPTHRAELARSIGVSRTTVSTIVSKLLAEGLVVEVAAGSAAGGRGELLSLNGTAGVAVGVDFAFDRARVAIVDLAHNRLGVRSAALPPGGEWQEAVDTARRLISSVLAEAGRGSARLVGIGVGVPGPVDRHSGVVGFSSNAASWVGVGVADVARRFDAPVLLDNTSHLGSLGEMAWGAAVGCKDVVYVKLATGVGAGFVLDGHVYKGSVGSAGEIGHITVDEQGPACRCGNRGCLEVYAGSNAVLDALRPTLGDGATIETVLTAAQAGDRACERVLADVGHVLGRAMANVCNLLNPERIVVGGELSGAGHLLLDPLRFALDRHALLIATKRLSVVPAELGEDAGALGGTALVLRPRQRSTTPSAGAEPPATFADVPTDKKDFAS